MSLRVQKPGRARTVSRHPDRPPIWAEGRQNPPFVPRAFLRASLQGARAAAAAGLDRAGSGLAAGEGTAPGALAGLCRRAALAARGIEPGPDIAALTAALAPAFRRDPAPPLPARPRRPEPARTGDPSLAAIRRALRDTAPALLPAGTDAPSPPPPAPPPRPDPAARGLGLVALALCLPIGAGLALAAHLAGEDLREAG